MADKTIETVNPLAEQALKTYPLMSDDEAMEVVQRSLDAFRQWRLKSLNEDAMHIANNSRYSLGGGISSRDLDREIKMASTYFGTGMVHINSFNIAIPNMPFGGVKDSGYGREHGEVGLKGLGDDKSITIADRDG